MSKNETRLERHIIGGHGPILEFVKNSESVGKYLWQITDEVDALRFAARIEQKADREFVVGLVNRMASLAKNNEELRQRFETTSRALVSINDSLRETEG